MARKKAARKSPYLRQRKTKNRRFILMVILIVIFTTIAYLFINKSMDAEMEYINREMKSTNKKLDDINEEISTLESDYEIRNTDDYKEKLAEEKLGMTKDKDSEESTDGND